ncbi:hypothetical protein ACFFV7_30765 [Nonomuraea spiralis]|uniref:Penicillin-binding protein n=1 Tax=Nonomuraea spiralis TaxID=46182 RepID=A0ABV5IMK9_9ACTN|nr:hypothetical protein [Nonomuraea spiralis]GGT01458.1 hypothetical protein GCM10010176_051950 [Nonomuraea spiralis]
MKRLLLVLGVVAVAAAVWGAAVLLSAPAGQAPDRQPLNVAPLVVRDSVIVDGGGQVVEKLAPDCAVSTHPAFCRRVRDELTAIDPRLLTRGGLVIATTLDPRAQRAAQRAIEARVRAADAPIAVQAMVAPGSGEIRALAASRGDGAHGLPRGSTAMAYTLAAAMAGGMRADDGLPRSGPYQATGREAFTDCEGDQVADPAHTVVDARDRSGGTFVTLRRGARDALNTFFMRLEERIGLCETVRTARALGLTRPGGVPVSEYEMFTLGVNDVDTVTVAGTYATLAAHGLRCAPRAVKEVRDASGKVLHALAPKCERALDPAVADAVTGLLRTGGLGRDAAGIADRTNEPRSAWYAGYTPDLASAVSLGFPDVPVRHGLSETPIGGRRYDVVDGAAIPGPIWRASMAEALRGVPESAFAAPDEARFGGCRLACAPK